MPRARKAATQRASLASSSEVNRKAASPCVTSAAASSAAAAPLMSQAPRPMARSAVTCSSNGLQVQCGESGTVSRCTLNRKRGRPRTAYSDTAPAPWSSTSTENPCVASRPRRWAKMPPVSIARGGLRVSKATSAFRWRSVASSIVAAAVDLRPQGGAHAEQPDEAFGLGHTPVGALRVGGATAGEDVRRTHGHRLHAAAVRLQHDLAVDTALAAGQEGLQVGLQRVVVEALVHQFHPLACHFRLEAVLLLAQYRLLEGAVGGEQGGQARCLEDDAALQADGGVAGIQAAADTVGG